MSSSSSRPVRNMTGTIGELANPLEDVKAARAGKEDVQ
jgi:hypothetical protein